MEKQTIPAWVAGDHYKGQGKWFTRSIAVAFALMIPFMFLFDFAVEVSRAAALCWLAAKDDWQEAVRSWRGGE